MAEELPGANIPIWGLYLKALAAQPLKVKCITSSVAFTLSQTLSQLITKGDIVNPKLIAAWSVWGVPSTIAAHNFANWMQKTHGHRPLLVKVILDHLLYRLAIMFIFTWYNKLSLTGGDKYGFLEALPEVMKVQPGMQKTSAKLWPTLMIANYTVVPLPLRVLYLNVCQFSWGLYLAFLYRKSSTKAVKDQDKVKR